MPERGEAFMPHRGQVFMPCGGADMLMLMICPALLLLLLMSCRGEVFMPCRRGENFNALSW